MKKSKISKYQSGGKSKMTQQELDLYNKYKGYVSSDTYRKRLQNFRTEEQAKEEQYTSLDRLKRAQPPVISPVRLPNKIQGWYENPGIILGLGNIMLSPNRDEFTYTHEMEHLNRSGGDRYNNAELSLLRSMNVNNKKFNQDQLDYLHDPTESGAKLSDIRGRAIKLGLHKNFGEEFTKEQLQAIYEQVEDDETLKFIEAYDHEVLLQALNTIADSGEQQEINIARNGGEIQELTMKKKTLPKGTNKYQQGGGTQRDSIQHQAEKILKYEQLRGGPGGVPLPSYSNPIYLDMLMQDILPEVEKIMPNATAMEKAEAMDFIFNAGYDKNNKKITRDPRAYALQEYYRKYDPSRLDKDGKWSGRKNPAYSFDEEYNDTIGRLPENERRILMNKGRDWYYRNIDNPAPGVYSPNYESTWYGRIWNTNDYSEFNPNNPKFNPKKQQGGLNSLFPYTDSLLNYNSEEDDKIKSFIKRNEGSVVDKDGRHRMYRDSEGYPTIGYGHLMRGVEAPVMTQEAADAVFNRDYEIHKKHAENIPGFKNLTDQQKAALIDMTFNMGENWHERFPKFTEALTRGDFNKATQELQDSLWYKQVGPRAKRVISMLGNKSSFQQGGIPDINQILGGFGTQFTDFMSQNPIFQNANKPPEILSEKEWRKQNGYKNFYLFGNKDQEAFRAYQEYVAQQQGMAKQGQEQFKQALPFGQAMFAFNQLNEMADLERGLGAKRDAYTLDDEVPQQAFKGYFKEGGIPDRYREMGFSRVGQKKDSTRDGKKWMVLAKKGDKYKVVHGGAEGMSDYTKHKDKDRRARFWKRHNAGSPGKSRDPFSPLFWHKKFGTWRDGGQPELDGLNEYQEGGNNSRLSMTPFLEKVGITPAEAEARTFLENSFDNPEYIQRIYNSAPRNLSVEDKKDFVNEVLNRRKINLRETLNRGKKDIEYMGVYFPKDHSVAFNKSGVNDTSVNVHELTHSMFRVGDNSLMSDYKKIQDNLIPEYNKNMILGEDKFNYLSDPEEVMARIYQVRQAANKYGITKPGGNISQTQMDDLINIIYKKGTNTEKGALEDFLYILKEDENNSNFDVLRNLLNSLTTNEKNTPVNVAKNGGGSKMNQQIMGYKDNSPYKNLPFQDFNTNTLTMQGVSKPILALPDRGQPQIMLPNSGIYSFPMANQIREIPLAQNGLKPTRQDSLMLYNNALEKERFYKNNPDYVKFKSSSTTNTDIPGIFSLFEQNKDIYNELANNNYIKDKRSGSRESRFKSINNSLIQLGDILSGHLDSYFNSKAPSILLHKNINPSGWNTYGNPSLRDVSDIPYYDQALVIPEDLVYKLTPKQREQREKYKQSPAYFKALQRQGILQPRPKINVNSLPTEITELPIEQPQINPQLSGRVRPNFLAKGEIIQESPSIPNVDIIFERRGNQRIPVFLQNQLGQRIPYNESERGEVDLREFQYPGNFQEGGPTGYSWSAGSQGASTVTTPSRSQQMRSDRKDLAKKQEEINKLSSEIIKSKKLGEYTPEDIQILSQSTLDNVKSNLREDRIVKANSAQQRGDSWSAEGFANSTAAVGDKLSLQRLPGVGQYIPDILDVTGGIGSMASGLGRIPLNIKEGEYGQATLNLGLPLFTGALAGLGTTTRGQFVNNLVNPVAGIKQSTKNMKSFYGDDFSPEWVDIGKGYSVSKHQGHIHGRPIMIVKDPNGATQPFYMRTGTGGEAMGWAEPGNWVPYDGHAYVPKGSIFGDKEIKGWFMKPEGRGTLNSNWEETSKYLGEVIGRGDAGRKKIMRPSNDFSNFENPEGIINDIFREYGFTPKFRRDLPDEQKFGIYEKGGQPKTNIMKNYQDGGQTTFEDQVYNLSPQQQEEYAVELASYMEKVGEDKMKKFAPKEYSFLMNYVNSSKSTADGNPNYDMEAPILPEIEKRGERIYTVDNETVNTPNSKLQLQLAPSEELLYRAEIEEINKRLLQSMEPKIGRNTQLPPLNEGFRQVLGQRVPMANQIREIPMAQNGGLARGGTRKVADYQEMLKAEGLYDGPVDGAWGPKTQRAYEEFTNRTKNLDVNRSRSIRSYLPIFGAARFQDGGLQSNVENKQQEAVGWLNQWRSSSMGSGMLRNSTNSEEEFLDVNNNREKSLSRLGPIQLLKRQEYHPTGVPKSGINYLNPLNNSSQTFVYPYGANSPTTILHETVHAEDFQGKYIPKKDKELIDSYLAKNFEDTPFANSEEAKGLTKKQLKAEEAYMKTYGKPKEVRPLLNQIRYTESTMPDRLYDPFTEKVTPEVFEKMKGKTYESEDKNVLKILQKNFSDDQIINLLNSVSSNNTNTSNFYAYNGGIPIAQNGFFSRLGRGIKNVARGVGNVAHDWGVGIADSFGNNTGMFDIDNSRYKTGLGRSVSGFNDQWQSGVGQVGRSIASTMVPGISNLTGMMGGNQQQMPQQQAQQYPQQQSGGFDQMQMLMSFLPYLQRGVQGQPMFFNGGKTNLTGRFNPYSQMSTGSFKQGGMATAKSSLITDSDSHNKKKGPGASYSKNGPMGPKGYNYSTGRRDVQDYTVFNEYIPTENLIPIQTEKDELIVLPTGDITPVMASKRHSRMGEDEVTDVTPEGSYILSAHGDVKIYRDEAQGLITEMGIKPYRLGYAQEKPTERTLADLMSGKKMSPAQLGAKVMKQFPIWKTNNIYEASANQENKVNRKPYLEGIIQLSELDRYRKGLVQPEQMRNGGSVMRRDFLPKAQTGLEVMLIGSALQSIMGGIGAQEQANRRNRDLLYTENNIINPAYNDASRLSWTGSGLNIASLMAQDTNVDSAQYDPSFIRQAQLTTPEPIRQTLSNRAYVNRPDYMRVAPNFSAGVSAEQAGYASALKQAYDTEIGIFNSDRSQKNKMLEVLQGYQDKNLDSRVAERNAETLNTNQKLSGLGAAGQGAFDTQSDLRLKRGQTLAQLRMQQSLNDSQAIAARYNAANNLIGTGTLAYQNYLQNRPPSTTTKPGGDYSGQDYECYGGFKYYIDSATGGRIKTNQPC